MKKNRPGNKVQSETSPSPEPPKITKKRKKKPLIIILDVLIVVLVLSGVFLLVKPYITAYKQDQVIDDIMAQVDAGIAAEPTIGATTEVPVNEPDPQTEATQVELGDDEAYFEGIWVDPRANAIPGEGWENFETEEETVETQAQPTANAYYVPDSYQLIPMGKIKIDAINLNLPLLKGAKLVPLRYGAGWLEQSSRLGENGRATILGHAMITGSDRFFTKIHQTNIGDTIEIAEKNRTLKYEIYDVKIISVSELQGYLLNPNTASEIMLVTCHNYPAWNQRCLVFARLVEVI